MDAKRRITLSALYIGGSRLDHFMLHQLANKIKGNHAVTIQLLIDHMRGTRTEKDGQSSFTVLKGLISREVRVAETSVG